ncbi:DUF4349 domain-containing protein [Streptomyces sp. NPDC020141]|uniref:DUF4349 domain-containing protein n=1 Tax=Streptomyces sp. NPDC020141 TaxID=3365065 RepID=UPI0037B89238
MRARRAFTAVVLIGSFALAGCGAGGDAGDGSMAKPVQDERRAAADDRGSGSAASRTEEEGSAGKGAKADRAALPVDHVIRTVELELEVGDAVKSLAGARRAAVDAGGHVADESTERLDEGRMTSRAVLRVPRREYDRVLAGLAGGGKLLSRKADAKDVTDQVVDVRSRVATQRASVARVRELMDRAEKLSDVVTLEEQLSERQAELESLLAKEASLKDRTALATITLTLTEPEAEVKEREDGAPGFADALGGGWDALAATGRWTAVVLGAVAPFAALLGLLFGVWRWGVRPRLRGRGLRAVAAASATGPAADGPGRE